MFSVVLLGLSLVYICMASEERVGVVTYNVFAMKEFIQTTGQTERLSNIPSYLNETVSSNVTVVVFEEVWSDMHADLLYSGMNKFGYQYRSKLLNDNVGLQNGGVMAVSKYPITDEKMIRYNNGVMPDNLASKGALMIKTVTTKGTPLYVFCTHLQSGLSGDQGQAQQLQLDQLNDFVKQQNFSKNDLVLVAGDFNIDQTLTPLNFRFLSNVMFRSRNNRPSGESIQPLKNNLVGLDGEASQSGCENTYQNAQNHCICCKRARYDYVFVYPGGRQPKLVVNKVVDTPLQSPLKICSNTWLKYIPIHVSPTSFFCSVAVDVVYLSDHMPVEYHLVF